MATHKLNPLASHGMLNKPKPRDYLLTKMMLDKDEKGEVPDGVIDDPIANLILGMPHGD